MITHNSPGGSIFPYYYKGGELHCLKYGSFYDKDGELFKLMKAEEEFLVNAYRRLPMWVDFYETRLTGRVLNEFHENLRHISPFILKLAVVGCPFWPEFRLRYRWRKAGERPPFPVQFFVDPEDAKSWLVGKS